LVSDWLTIHHLFVIEKTERFNEVFVVFFCVPGAGESGKSTIVKQMK